MQTISPASSFQGEGVRVKAGRLVPLLMYDNYNSPKLILIFKVDYLGWNLIMSYISALGTAPPGLMQHIADRNA